MAPLANSRTVAVAGHVLDAHDLARHLVVPVVLEELVPAARSASQRGVCGDSMTVGLVLLLATATGGPLPCQREAIIDLFKATASGKGTIADVTRLVANQGEIEAGLLECKLFPKVRGQLSPEQEEPVREILRHPASNPSESLAYLRYRWPEIFGKKIDANEVMGPVIEMNPTTIIYQVGHGAQAVRFRFEETSCRVLTIQMANGRSALGEIDCWWRAKVGNDVLGYFARREPGLRWRGPPLVADVTLDGVPDYVVLGSGPSGTAVGILEGFPGDGAQHWVVSFRHDPQSQAGLCGKPADASVALEEPRLPLDELGCAFGSEDPRCHELREVDKRLRDAAVRGSKGIRLSAGECDAFHLYYDGAGFRWWRR